MRFPQMTLQCTTGPVIFMLDGVPLSDLPFKRGLQVRRIVNVEVQRIHGYTPIRWVVVSEADSAIAKALAANNVSRCYNWETHPLPYIIHNSLPGVLLPTWLHANVTHDQMKHARPNTGKIFMKLITSNKPHEIISIRSRSPICNWTESYLACRTVASLETNQKLYLIRETPTNRTRR